MLHLKHLRRHQHQLIPVSCEVHGVGSQPIALIPLATVTEAHEGSGLDIYGSQTEQRREAGMGVPGFPFSGSRQHLFQLRQTRLPSCLVGTEETGDQQSRGHKVLASG
jgi:hypothetical protein